MENKPLQILILVLVVFSTIISLLTFVTLMRLKGSVSFNSSDAFSGGLNSIFNTNPINPNPIIGEQGGFFDSTRSSTGAPSQAEVHACTNKNPKGKPPGGHFECQIRNADHVCIHVTCVPNDGSGGGVEDEEEEEDAW